MSHRGGYINQLGQCDIVDIPSPTDQPTTGSGDVGTACLCLEEELGLLGCGPVGQLLVEPLQVLAGQGAAQPVHILQPTHQLTATTGKVIVLLEMLCVCVRVCV